MNPGGELGFLDWLPAGSKSVTLAGEREDGSVMDEAIDDGASRHLIREDLRPFLEVEIRCQRDTAPLVPLRNELKE